MQEEKLIEYLTMQRQGSLPTGKETWNKEAQKANYSDVNDTHTNI